MGHLGPFCSKEITVTFSAIEPVKLTDIPITCTLRRIAYVTPDDSTGEDNDMSVCGKEGSNDVEKDE